MLVATGTLTLVVLREHAEQINDKDRFISTSSTRYRALELVSVDGGAPVYTMTVFQRSQAGAVLVSTEGPIIPTRRGAPLGFIPFVFIGPPCDRLRVRG